MLMKGLEYGTVHFFIFFLCKSVPTIKHSRQL